MQAHFVTSCGTDAGKTFITTALCWNFRRIGEAVQAIKPVVSGYNEDNPECSDTFQIIASLGYDFTQENVDKVSPWRLKHPRAPNIASRMEGVNLNYSEILRFCAERCKNASGHILIEGVGGVMSPLTDEKSCIDLIKDLDIAVVLVANPYLGSISHVLTALEALRGMQVKIVITLKDLGNTHCTDLVECLRSYCGRSAYVQGHVSGEHEKWVLAGQGIVDFITNNSA
ncbi:dethiobiotin synthase [Anaplasma centrale str. Israel]|uniref:ATP-dependent dethiobiotin synthetase BioD n=1 Tax=Anaplasma centrale (strain Israel) TaxID=574556 RepID=D1ATN6_ANACI|nr:dethiobiotin synthase [Anaplasma centrale]ACZ48914.1 dethiobiotin synthase [Anaplasma centrale str. Israel]